MALRPPPSYGQMPEAQRSPGNRRRQNPGLGCSEQFNDSSLSEQQRNKPGFPRWIGLAGPKAAETLARRRIPYFHPSRPSGLGYLTPNKLLIRPDKLASGAGRMPFHPANPG